MESIATKPRRWAAKELIEDLKKNKLELLKLNRWILHAMNCRNAHPRSSARLEDQLSTHLAAVPSSYSSCCRRSAIKGFGDSLPCPPAGLQHTIVKNAPSPSEIHHTHATYQSSLRRYRKKSVPV